MNALCEAIDIADTHKVAQSLVRVFEYYKNTRLLLRTVISKEVSATGINDYFLISIYYNNKNSNGIMIY